MGKKYTILPHPDIELGFERKHLDYFMTLPEKGIDENTGLIFVMPGTTGAADEEYYQKKLRPYLANKYNCIAVGVNYFGVKIYAGQDDTDLFACNVNPGDFVNKIFKMFDLKPQDFIVNGNLRMDLLVQTLAAHGVKELGPEFKVICKKQFGGNSIEYESFGLLPAIDHIQVLGEVLRNYRISRKRVLAFGTSYGGYLALLLGKFAPHTFSAIIDNSGFVRTRVDFIATNEVYYHDQIRQFFVVRGVKVPSVPYSPWTLSDETSPYYFSESHRCIRSLLNEEHITESPTRYYFFHSSGDTLVPIEEKNKLVNMIRNKGMEVYYKVVNPEDIDGKLFKTMAHGMDASLKRIFDYVAERDGNNLCKADSLTDFDRESVYEFDCGERTYIFSYGRDFGINVRCEKKKD